MCIIYVENHPFKRRIIDTCVANIGVRMGIEVMREIYKLEWNDKPNEELIPELKRLSELSLKEPLHITHPAMAEKFLALGDIWKARRGVEVGK